MEGLGCIGIVIGALLLMFHNEIKDFFNKPSQQEIDQQHDDYLKQQQAWEDKHNKFFLDIVEKHFRTLINKRMNLTTSNDYGVEDLTAFKKELGYFIDSVVLPEHKRWVENLDWSDKWRLSDEEREQKPKWKKIIAEMLLEIMEGQWQRDDVQKQVAEIKASNEPMPDDPYEFERWVARLMEKGGWKARATSGSGDQGADVIAEKDGWKVIVQCKKYKKSVGNKAVQEALAAKTHFNGTHAIVVNSSGTFTKAARELAATSGVKLMHPNDLQEWSPD